jgi:hypothetical protein
MDSFLAVIWWMEQENADLGNSPELMLIFSWSHSGRQAVRTPSPGSLFARLWRPFPRRRHALTPYWRSFRRKPDTLIFRGRINFRRTAATIRSSNPAIGKSAERPPGLGRRVAVRRFDRAESSGDGGKPCASLDNGTARARTQTAGALWPRVRNHDGLRPNPSPLRRLAPARVKSGQLQ